MEYQLIILSLLIVVVDPSSDPKECISSGCSRSVSVWTDSITSGVSIGSRRISRIPPPTLIIILSAIFVFPIKNILWRSAQKFLLLTAYQGISGNFKPEGEGRLEPRKKPAKMLFYITKAFKRIRRFCCFFNNNKPLSFLKRLFLQLVLPIPAAKNIKRI
jgi:hypothetical protein